jgi:plastocyanin
MMRKILVSIESALHRLGRLSARQVIAGACCLVVLEGSGLALAAENHRIAQQRRAFNVPAIKIAVGDTLEFSNDDDFIHQVYIQSPSLNFDSPEQPPGQIITIKFPTAGNFEVRCHIHPKMLLKVDVT